MEQISWRCGCVGSVMPSSWLTSGLYAPHAFTTTVVRTRPAFGHDRRDTAPARLDARHARERMHRDAQGLRALRVAPHERPRKYHRVTRIVARGLHALGRQLGHHLRDARVRQELAVHATAILQLHIGRELRRRLRRARQKQIPARAKPSVDLVPLRKLTKQRKALAHQPNVDLTRPLRAHAAAVPPARPTTQVTRVQHRDPRNPVLRRQMIRDRQPHDARPNHHHIRVTRQGVTHPAKCSANSQEWAPAGFATHLPAPLRCPSSGREI